MLPDFAPVLVAGADALLEHHYSRGVWVMRASDEETAWGHGQGRVVPQD